MQRRRPTKDLDGNTTSETDRPDSNGSDHDFEDADSYYNYSRADYRSQGKLYFYGQGDLVSCITRSLPTSSSHGA